MNTKKWKNCGVALMMLIIVSCGVSNVVINGSFPTPNIAKLPIFVAVIYDDALREFSFMEYTETGEEEFNIEIPDEEAESLLSVGQAVKYITNKLN